MNQKNEAPADCSLSGPGNSVFDSGIILPDTPSVDKYKIYEARKKELQSMGLKPYQYDIEIMIITEQLGI